MAPSIAIKDLSFRYFETADPVFSGLNLDFLAGSCCAILGPTGSGKTTLLQLLSGIIGSQFQTSVASGSVTVGDTRYDPIPPRVLFPVAGYVMQDPSLQLSGVKETVREEIAFTLDNLNIAPEDQQQQLDDILATFRIQALAQRSPSRLSGGELQRVALASILVAAPTLLLLDEPATALDGHTQQILRSVLHSLKGNSTIILSDTSLEFSLGVADHFVIFDRGSVVFSGSRPELLNSLVQFEHLLPLEHWADLFAESVQAHPRLYHFLGQK